MSYIPFFLLLEYLRAGHSLLQNSSPRVSCIVCSAWATTGIWTTPSGAYWTAIVFTSFRTCVPTGRCAVTCERMPPGRISTASGPPSRVARRTTTRRRRCYDRPKFMPCYRGWTRPDAISSSTCTATRRYRTCSSRARQRLPSGATGFGICTDISLKGTYDQTPTCRRKSATPPR